MTYVNREFVFGKTGNFVACLGHNLFVFLVCLKLQVGDFLTPIQTINTKLPSKVHEHKDIFRF